MGVIQKLYDFVNPEFFILAAKAREIFTPARMMTLSYNLCMIITALLNARLLPHFTAEKPALCPLPSLLPHKTSSSLPARTTMADHSPLKQRFLSSEWLPNSGRHSHLFIYFNQRLPSFYRPTLPLPTPTRNTSVNKISLLTGQSRRPENNNSGCSNDGLTRIIKPWKSDNVSFESGQR